MYSCGYGEISRRLLGLAGLLDMDSAAPNGAGSPEFSLPGDEPRYAPDRKADVRHLDLDVTLDFDHERVSGVVTISFEALFEDVSEITLDAAELAIEEVTMAGKKTPLRFFGLVTRVPGGGFVKFDKSAIGEGNG